MHILVTGSNGMVGRHVREAVARGNASLSWRFTFATRQDCDLCDAAAVNRYFQTHRFDAIIHLAANVGGLYKNIKQNCSMFSDNMRMTLNVLDACIKYKVTRGLFMLSSCVFPGYATRFPMTESDLHVGRPHASNAGYAYAKRMLEVYVRLARKEHGFQYTCVTPVNLYGPHDNFRLHEAHVVPALVRRFADALDVGATRFTVYGSGTPLRQFLYAPDLVRMLFFLLALETPPEHVICCNDEELSIAAMATALAKTMGITPDQLDYDMSKADGCARKTVSNALLRTLGYDTRQCTLFAEGIRHTVAWYQRARRGNNEKDMRI